MRGLDRALPAGGGFSEAVWRSIRAFLQRLSERNNVIIIPKLLDLKQTAQRQVFSAKKQEDS